MLKQKMAVLFASLFLLSTVILPGLAFAADTDSTGTLNLTGTKDVWYSGYGIADTTIQDLTFQDGSCSTTNVTVSATADVPSFTEESCTLNATDLMGVINYDNAAWSLKVQANTNFAGPGSAVIPIASNLFVATAGTDAQFDAGWTATHLADNLAVGDVTFTNNAADNVYYEVAGSGYSYVAGDVSAPVKTTDSLQTAATFTTSGINVSAAGVTILSSAQTDAFGIFAVAPAYYLNVPTGSAAVTYTNTFTYTVS